MSQKKTNIFISYSRQRKDSAIAGLLAEVLRSQGYAPRYDEAQARGTSASDGVSGDLRRCDAVVVLLTEESESSPWVNQELGFAKALYKPILPVKISANCNPPGLLSGIRPIEIGNWFAKEHVSKIGSELRTLTSNIGASPPMLIVGEEQRTNIMISKLQEIYDRLQHTGQELQMYEQSALSIFSVASTQPRGYSNNYWQALRQQNLKMQQLIDHSSVQLWLHMWPNTREYDPQARTQRLQHLLEWLEKSTHTNRVHVRISKHNGPNILAIDGDSAFEGLRATRGDEYSYTLVWSPNSKRHTACFQEVSQGEWITPSEAAARLRELEDRK